MGEAARVELTLLGRTLAIRTEASPEYLRSLVADVEERVAELTRSGVRDPMTALGLAALDMADELARVRDDRTRAEGDVGERIGALLTLLDRVAPRDRPTDEKA